MIFPSLQGPEIIVIMLVALIILGPERLPEVARTLAKAFRQLKDAQSQVQAELQTVTQEFSGIRPTVEEMSQAIKNPQNLLPLDAPPTPQPEPVIEGLPPRPERPLGPPRDEVDRAASTVPPHAETASQVVGEDLDGASEEIELVVDEPTAAPALGSLEAKGTLGAQTDQAAATDGADGMVPSADQTGDNHAPAPQASHN
ncbi:MAG: twin-arginine translocase TatA/TatE family subunit [Acidimicrobiia bacterium]|nr:twin-arginine translocase TatA/TatE family subunit [Acidimicrobiia bacterium]MBP8179556.1 twin-arginine translocase TatA/TatE family subunit [Acidimicrobiia bacterium]